MGESLPVGRACGLCGEQVILSIETDGGTYTDDLTALLQAGRGDRLIIKARCDCTRPQIVALKGTIYSDTYRD